MEIIPPIFEASPLSLPGKSHTPSLTVGLPPGRASAVPVIALSPGARDPSSLRSHRALPPVVGTSTHKQ